MSSIIRATTTSGLQVAPDNSGSLQFQTNGTTAAVAIDTSQNLQFNSGYGSVATAYGCRAWVNFNGTGTVAIRGSGNVSSITDNGTGDYTVNFTNAMPDANYATTAMTNSWDSTQTANTVVGFQTTNSSDPTTYTSSAVRISLKRTQSTTLDDRPYISFSIFR